MLTYTVMTDRDARDLFFAQVASQKAREDDVDAVPEYDEDGIFIPGVDEWYPEIAERWYDRDGYDREQDTERAFWDHH